jgi:hypothetical protein
MYQDIDCHPVYFCNRRSFNLAKSAQGFNFWHIDSENMIIVFATEGEQTAFATELNNRRLEYLVLGD